MCCIQKQEDAQEYLEEAKLKELVAKYSEFINFPIYLYSSKEVEKEVPVEEQLAGDDEKETEEETDADKDDDEDSDDVEDAGEARLSSCRHACIMMGAPNKQQWLASTSLLAILEECMGTPLLHLRPSMCHCSIARPGC